MRRIAVGERVRGPAADADPGLDERAQPERLHLDRLPDARVTTRSRTLVSIRGFRSTSGGRRSMSGPMPDDALVLHAETMWASPYVFSSWVALHEKGLRFPT